MTAGTLHVCAVPIGNLEDASPRLRRVLGEVDVIACEDTRTTGRLLELLGVERQARLLAHHEHNARASASGLVELLLAGQDVAIVSDAGTPAVSDPGVELVEAALAAGVAVVAVPGPSAVAAAVSIAGIAGDGYRFVGFLPRADGELRSLLTGHAAELVVAFEAPRRIRESLAVVAELQPEREIVVCRELTKLHESVVRGAAAEVLERLADDVKGEIVLVLAPLARASAGDAEVDRAAIALARSIAEAGVRTKDAARIAATHLGVSTRSLYAALHESRD